MIVSDTFIVFYEIFHLHHFFIYFFSHVSNSNRRNSLVSSFPTLIFIKSSFQLLLSSLILDSVPITDPALATTNSATAHQCRHRYLHCPTWCSSISPTLHRQTSLYLSIFLWTSQTLLTSTSKVVMRQFFSCLQELLFLSCHCFV